MSRTLYLALLAASVGAAGAAVAVVGEWHRHTCETCGHRWSHLGAFNVGNLAAHTCGRCGREQWWKDGVPDHIKVAHAQHVAMHSAQTRAEPRQVDNRGAY